jgi:predicted nucleic acid-binding protein
MNPPPLSFMDANVIMYAIGGVHPYREPCVMLLQKIKSGEVRVVSNTEVLREILYRYFSIKKSFIAESAYTSLVELCEQILPVTLKDMQRALELLKRNPDITPRDAVHAATMIHNGIKKIHSTDPHFDRIPGIRRIKPA